MQCVIPKRTRLSAETKEALLQAFVAGKRKITIAAELNIPYQTVVDYERRYRSTIMEAKGCKIGGTPKLEVIADIVRKRTTNKGVSNIENAEKTADMHETPETPLGDAPAEHAELSAEEREQAETPVATRDNASCHSSAENTCTRPAAEQSFDGQMYENDAGGVDRLETFSEWTEKRLTVLKAMARGWIESPVMPQSAVLKLMTQIRIIQDSSRLYEQATAPSYWKTIPTRTVKATDGQREFELIVLECAKCGYEMVESHNSMHGRYCPYCGSEMTGDDGSGTLKTTDRKGE